MRKFSLAFLLVGTLATVAAVGPACVSQRPSRNGVFNENQYVRKDFLVRAGDGTGADNGWFLKATILNTSQPNPVPGLINPGETTEPFWGMSDLGAKFVRFKVTQDKLQMVSMREIAPTQNGLQRTEEVLDAWPVTNVDLKYRVNLDGEKTNFYEENQELDWQVRQWVKLNLNKNDMSDLQAFGPYMYGMAHLCMDEGNTTTTLVPDSFKVSEEEDYMEWTVNVTMPTNPVADPACGGIYAGDEDFLTPYMMDRFSVSFNVKYSFVRAKPMSEITYQPLVIDEKDPIQHKYYPWTVMGVTRDQDSQLLAARTMVRRFDPTKPIVWYFAPGFPQYLKDSAMGPMTEQTNQMFQEAGVAARLSFKEWNDGGIERHYGDIRYNFVRWLPGYDNGTNGWAGSTPGQADPRTGELISAQIDLSDFPMKDYYLHRIDAYMSMIGAHPKDANGDEIAFDSTEEWPNDPPGCKDGEVQPILPDELVKNHNGNSSLYNKMQGYLSKSIYQYGPLGPQDFIAQQDEDFYRAYFTVLPYQIYADPDMNPYVIREGGAGVYGPDGMNKLLQMYRDEQEFHDYAAKIERGLTPSDDLEGPHGLENSLKFLNRYKQLMTNHRNVEIAKRNLFGRSRDDYNVVSFLGVMSQNARMCVNGAWETKAQWADRLVRNYWIDTFWHEFGHAMGLHHNFMGSIDRPNWPKDANGNPTYYSSSIMEYSGGPVRTLKPQGWLPYDVATLSWAYANNGETQPSKQGDSISGQSKVGDPAFTPPWVDPKGFNADGTERQYLFCSHQHIQYTPLCRMGDLGATPSEIQANQIDSYEWGYHWRNFRVYRKLWNNAYYAGSPANMVIDMRRWLTLWGYDWDGGLLYDMLRRIEYPVPDGVYSNVQYYSQLTNKFNKEASTASQMTAAFHKAVIQQSAGERPYSTIYDKYYGDVTQQGIILDKLYAMLGWVGLWPTDNIDPNRAGGWIASYASLGDSSYSYVAEDTISSMVGGAYDAYPYFVPYAVGIFAQDTHDPAFNGRREVRDWIGGFVFDRLQDFLDYFRNMAVEQMYPPDCVGKTYDTCDFDPRTISDKHNEFIGPDKRVWSWAYVQDRNQYVAVRKDRNIASYIILRNYNDYVVYQLDDGHHPGGAYGAQLPLKYFLDSFRYFN